MQFPDYFQEALSFVPEDRGGASVDADASLSPTGLPPWLQPPPDIPADAEVVSASVGVGPGNPTVLPPEIFEESAEISVPDVDAIALYRPWHFFREAWGVYVFERPLLAFTRTIAEACNEDPRRMAALVFRQVLEHEWTHFDIEVIATGLEEVLSEPCYVSYSWERFRLPYRDVAETGPLEEAVATWSEVRFARGRLPGQLGPKPPVYVAAVEQVADRSPDGYREWRCMLPARNRERVIAAVASLILAHHPGLATGTWWKPSAATRRQVPIYWIGNPDHLSGFGGKAKSLAAPSIRVLRKWLQRCVGARIENDRGRGSHERYVLPDGRSDVYATSAGFLLPPEAKKMATLLGHRSPRDLYLAIQQGC